MLKNHLETSSVQGGNLQAQLNVTEEKKTVRINEIFTSLQGEGKFMGLPTVFVRFQGCRAFCNFCDTPYAQDEEGGEEVSITHVISKIANEPNAKRVCLSVDEDEPVVIKKHDVIRTMPIKEASKLENFSTLTYENGEAVFKPVTGVWSHKTNKQYKVKTKPMSMEVTMTGSHSVMVATKDGIKSKLVEDLEKGDFLLSPKEIKTNEKNEVSADEARYLGWLVAEGSPTEFGYSVATATKEDSEEVLNLHKKVTDNSGSIQHNTLEEQKQVFRNTDYIEPTEEYYWCELSGGREYSKNITNQIGRGAKNKRIPPKLFNANKEVKKEFLKSLSKGDGTINHDDERSRHDINITTSSRRLANDILTLGQTMNLHGRAETFDKYSPKDNRYLGIQYKVVFPYNDCQIGNRKHNARITGIPKELCGVSVDRDDPHATKRLRREDANITHFDDWNILEVNDIKEVKEERTVYDFEVPGTNTFTAGLGNILCHNTGGEPLLQKDAVKEIIKRSPLPVSVETNGLHRFDDLDCPCTVDIKMPSSGVDLDMKWIYKARPIDEFKIVVGGEEDFMKATAVIQSLRDSNKDNPVWISPCYGDIEMDELAEWILDNPFLKGDVRMQIQMHKVIWDPKARGK